MTTVLTLFPSLPTQAPCSLGERAQVYMVPTCLPALMSHLELNHLMDKSSLLDGLMESEAGSPWLDETPILETKSDSWYDPKQRFSSLFWFHFPAILPEPSVSSLQASVPSLGNVAHGVTGAHAYSIPCTGLGSRGCPLHARSPPPPTGWLWVPVQTLATAISPSEEQGVLPTPVPQGWPSLELPSDLLLQRQAKSCALTAGSEQLCVRQAAGQRQQSWLK